MGKVLHVIFANFFGTIPYCKIEDFGMSSLKAELFTIGFDHRIADMFELYDSMYIKKGLTFNANFSFDPWSS